LVDGSDVVQIFKGIAAGVLIASAGSAGAEQRIVQATGGIVNLRAEAGWWADVAGLAQSGAKVEVLARSGGWAWVQTGNGTVGWLPAAELARPVVRVAPTRAAAPAPRPAAAPEGIYLSVVLTDAGALNLRDGPGGDHTVVAQMKRGSWVEVQDRVGGWAKLRHESGAEGWALRRYLVR